MAQTLKIQFFDPVEANVVNQRFYAIRQRGFYSGAYVVSYPDDHSIIINPYVCEISDSNGYQVKISETANTTITGIYDGTTNYVVFRWAYSPSGPTLGTFLAVTSANVTPYDLIVGRAVYSGTLLGINYAQRTRPDTMDLFLKVEQFVPANMTVMVRGGRVSYGTSNYDIPDQQFPLSVAGMTGGTSRIDVLYVASDGTVQKITGTAAATPTVPPYAGKKAIAEVTLTAGMTTITQGDTSFFLPDGITPRLVIRDVRCFIGGGTSTFLNLSDAPSTYTGQAGKVVRVNTAETALEFGAAKYQ